MNKSLGLLCAMSLLAGCASERVVLLPTQDGRASAVVIRDADGGEVRLDRPYAATVRQFGNVTEYRSSVEDLQARFGAALAAQPARPASYLLYFQPGGEQLTDASQAELGKVRQDIAARTASEAMVIGHTDSVGGADGNDRLSLKRAEAVRQLLVDTGIAVDRIEVVGRGERELLVPTGDEVDEPRNRRVEIVVR
ncbi:MAG: OmpA family protein [Azonexaceae bacterium]|uniref:OmpA family protein n=1 Tax=Azonexus sp. R2A61 TaxID=2744443 RepID=UPI001F47BC95|nr:OmpA family protein [Azonexus sp. R2A61]MCE1238520.1 OmpA family protein [Azonexaceae bacterium]